MCVCEIFLYLAAPSAALGVVPCNNDVMAVCMEKAGLKGQHCMNSHEGFAAALPMSCACLWAVPHPGPNLDQYKV